MAALRVQICNERFLLRFGVDRILTLLAEHLAGAGAEVTLTCLRADRPALARITDAVDVIELPEGLDLARTDALASRRVLQSWEASRPDVIVTGGWPFFGVAAAASSRGVRSIFIDAGAVPHDGMPAEGLPSQLELRRLRQRTLPSIGTCLPISAFICDSQTRADRGSDHNVRTILLGSDHLVNRRFDGVGLSRGEQAVLDGLDVSLRAGAVILLLLGRFEADGYKNSPAVFDILRRVRTSVPAAHLVVLAGPDHVDVPDDLQAAVTCLGTIGDEALQEVMKRASLGLSLSLWEGFNLPLAEMQQLDKPVLAFNAGAHPEVIADPWFLCLDLQEMADKTALVAAGAIPEVVRSADPFRRFRDRFGWDAVLERWRSEIEGTSDARPEPGPGRRLVLVDVTNAARDPANPGVIRVTRRLTAELAEQGELDVVPVVWNLERSTYTLPNASVAFLASNSGPSNWLGATAARIAMPSIEALLLSADPASARPPVLFAPEVLLDGAGAARLIWARRNGLVTAVILHDLLPIFEPDFISEDVTAAFPAYVDTVLQTDLVLANSNFTLGELQRYCGSIRRQPSGRVEAIWLPGQFGNHPRVKTLPPETPLLEILCVSTIEPRKNHRTLVAAFEDLRQRRPDLPIRLNLVGNLYGGDTSISEWVEERARKDERLVWHQILSDAELGRFFETSAFTIYPSLAEGFGLPILESLWMGRPCICHRGGVMLELAVDGGCLAVDASDMRELSVAIEQLSVDRARREGLAREAAGREIATWRQYAGEVGALLSES